MGAIRSRRRIRATALGAAALVGHALLACSFAVPWTQPISIVASHPEAEILVDGKPVGVGSANVRLRRDEFHSILARHGERSGTATLSRTISVPGMLDLVGGMAVYLPWLGVLAPGFWRLEPDTVSVAVNCAGAECPDQSSPPPVTPLLR